MDQKTLDELHKKQIEMLSITIDICEKLNLELFLVCGTALGAVKYGGFIPWDDDVDVAMRREDYEIFLEKASAMLPDNIILQNIHTNKAFPLLMTKMVNVGTTLIEKSYAHLPIHHGIYLDIFPLDGYPAGRINGRIFEMRKWIYNKLRCFAYCYGYRIFNLNGIMLGYEKMLKANKCENSVLLCNFGNWQGRLDYSPVDEFGKGTPCVFEGLHAKVPEKFDSYFIRKYGRWEKDLPEEKKFSHHALLKCDPLRPYRYYTYREKGKLKVRNGQNYD